MACRVARKMHFENARDPEVALGRAIGDYVVPNRPRRQGQNHADSQYRWAKQESRTEHPAGRRSKSRPGSQHRREDQRHRLRKHADPEKKAANQPEDDIARSLVREQCGDREDYQKSDLDVAVSVLTGEKNRDRVKRDPYQQCAPDRVWTRSCSHEREVESHDRRRLDEHEVEPKCRQKRDADSARGVIEGHDHDEPERWPVQEARLVRIPTLGLRVEDIRQNPTSRERLRRSRRRTPPSRPKRPPARWRCPALPGEASSLAATSVHPPPTTP